MDSLLYHDSMYSSFYIANDPLDNAVPSLHIAIPFGIIALNWLHVRQLGISMKEAKTLIETYFKTYPGIQEYITKTIEEAHIKGFVSTINGRKKYSQSLASSNMNVQKAEERALINMPIQGTAAELIKLAMINIQNKIISEDYNAKMILQIHDELIFEVPKNEIENFSKLVKFEMENAMKLSIPLKVEYNFGPSWYDAH